MGVKSVLPFSKLIIGKSQVFSARLYVYTAIRKYMTGGHNMLPAGPDRVNVIKVITGQ